MFKNSHQYGPGPIRRFFRSLSDRFWGVLGASLDWIASKTIGSSLFRSGAEKQRYAKWKLAVWIDEAWLKITTIFRRTSAPGRRAKSKVLGGVAAFWNGLIAPILRAVTKPIRWATFALLSLIESVFAKAASDPRLRYLVLPFQILYRLGAVIAEFIVAWFGTRHYRALLFGLPAIVLLMPLAICLVRIPLHGAHAKARHYQKAAYEAIREQEFETADLMFRKLQQLGIDRPQVIYSEATVLAQKGETDAAYKKMKTIAPLENGGFPAAHFWIAKAAFGDVITVPADERIKLVKAHLKHVLDQYPDDPLATQLMADVAWQEGRRQDAESMIGGVAGTKLSPGSQAGMAATFSRWGKAESARQFAVMADDGYTALVEQEKIDTLGRGDFLLWTAAAELADRDEQSMNVLKMLIENLEPDEGTLQFVQGMSRGLLDSNWRSDRTRWLDLLQLGLQIEPAREALLDTAASHVASSDTSDRAELAGQIRQLALDSGELTLRGHQLLADLALKAADYETARKDYLAIVDRDDDNLKAHNNLAWLFANNSPTDLRTAMTHADRAVELAPGDAAVLETRGQILVQLRRWNDAAADLEGALNGIPNHVPIHDSLAVCYDNTSRPDLAAAHRQRAATLRAKQL